MMPLRDLDQILSQLSPQIGGTYYFATVEHLPEGLTPFAMVQENEGITVIVSDDQAKEFGFPAVQPMVRISLGAYTSLEAVGITATVAQTLASRGIACNVIAGYYHDHIFVPSSKSKEAERLLQNLVEQAQGWLPTRK